MYEYVRSLLSPTLVFAVIARFFHLGEAWEDGEEDVERAREQRPVAA